MRVGVDTTTGFAAGAPELLFGGRYYADPRVAVRGRTYDVSPDARRFLMIKELEPPGQPTAIAQSLILVTNWIETMKHAGR
jgi:hypothetical protein